MVATRPTVLAAPGGTGNGLPLDGPPLDGPSMLAEAQRAPWVGEAVPQLGPGRPGKDGLLDLNLAKDGVTGRTIARRITHRSPLQIGRVLYPDAALPDMAYCYTAMLTGGLVQGDRLRLRATLQASARAHVTTLAATKVYGMERSGAEQSISLEVGEGAYLEWWPDPLIPYRGARLWQTVAAQVHSSGALLYGDLVLPGRTASGETHDYAFYRSSVSLRRPGGGPLAVDTQALAPPPPTARPLRETLPAGLSVIGTVYMVVPAAIAPPLLEACRAWCASLDPSAVLAGCSSLPGGAGVLVRFLTNESGRGRSALATSAALFRREVLQAPWPTSRKP